MDRTIRNHSSDAVHVRIFQIVWTVPVLWIMYSGWNNGVSLEDMDKLWGYDRSATNGGREVNDGERKDVREDEEAKSMSMSSSSDAWEKEQEERVEGSKMEA
ncbi:hypothetical protein BT69DRAFT_1343375 [Atractiella rhizophila]|nr:hypothetical protein BT69DRAFT_1343375 [Atractiella rhizophila]